MRLRRSRLVALVAAVLCVALAAAALRTAEAAPPYEVVRGTTGHHVAVEDGEISVGDVRVGTQLTRNGTVTDTTPGMFVVVAVTAAATGRDTLRRGDARLLARGDRVYAAYGGNATLVAAPGFEERTDLVFEVDPARIDDLTLELWQAEIIHGYQQRLQVHLGITPGNADQWRAAAPDQAVEADVYGSTRALS
jgi:hypothetical protein